MLRKINLGCFFIFTFIILHSVLSDEIEPREDLVLLNTKPRPELSYSYSNNGGEWEQNIVLEEEVEGEVILGQFNYKGGAPVMTLPNENDNLVFGLKVRLSEEENAWHLVLKNRQDYESPYAKFIRMTFKFNNEDKDSIVTLEIKNIDDNPPVITGKTCQVTDGRTNCKYSITDSDGLMSLESVKVSIIPRTHEEDTLFGIEVIQLIYPPRVNEDDNNSVELIIGLTILNELDYDKERLHIFSIAATDSALNQGRFTAVIEVIRGSTIT